VVIQVSTDLENWTDLMTSVVGTIPVILFSDAEAGLYPHRFYRAASAPSGITFQAGNALQLDGVAARAEVPHDDALNTLPLTISLWVKTTDSAYVARGLVSKYADASASGYTLMLSDGKVRGWYFMDGHNYVWDGGLGLDGGFVADGAWHHVVLTLDDIGGRLYVDGRETAALPWVGIPSATSTPEVLQFGHYSNHPVTLNGEVDDISIWRRTFSELEVFDLLHFGPNGDEFGLVAHWRFDEEDADGPTANDVTGNGHNATLLNNATRAPSAAPIRR
jgi:hypothetical protein